MKIPALPRALATATADARRLDRLEDHRERREMRREVERLGAFRQAIGGADRAFFMFFSGGLLHWAARALRLVPKMVPLVLLGTELDAQEKRWAAERSGRPFHHIDLRVDDCAVLDLLLESSPTGFGWLHVDCFVFNPELFAELSNPGPEAVRTVWTTGALGPVPIAHSACVFLESAPFRVLRQAGLRASLVPHSWDGGWHGRHAGHREVQARVPTAKEIALARRTLPLDGAGLPQLPEGFEYFPLLSWYQALAAAVGHPTRAVRDLARSGRVSVAQFSPEVVHVNGVATYRKIYRRFLEWRKAQPELEPPPLVEFYPQLLAIDYLLLQASLEQLPESYRRRAEELEAEARAIGLEPAEVANHLGAFLESLGVDRGLLRHLLA